MKSIALYFGIATALVVSCSTQEKDFQIITRDDVVFYASFEQPIASETRVFANEDLFLRWNSDDRVSIFNKITYNQQYKFTGETGDNSGGFKKVDTDEFVTGNTISHVVSVYPYQETTKITESEVLTVTLPAEQHYTENTFGLGANTMVSVSSDNVLQYKNIGGYLVVKLYGNGVSVSSITLKGNNGEKLAGRAMVTTSLDSAPTVTMADDASTEITLKCDEPIQLGMTSEENKEFWFVVPPITFSRGFSIFVTETTNGVFEKATTKSITIERSNVSRMSSVAVERVIDPNRIIYYTSNDGKIVTPSSTDVFGAKIISNEYVEGKGMIVFDGNVERIGDYAFEGCTNLNSIDLGSSILSIGTHAFYGCSALSEISIPDSVLSIGDEALRSCQRIHIGANVYSISTSAFSPASIQKLIVSEQNKTYDSRDSCNSLIETQTNTLICGGKNSSIPEGVEVIGKNAFLESGMETIIIPSSVVLIKERAFSNYNVFKTVYCYADTPPTLEFMSLYSYWHPFYSSMMWAYQTTVYVPNDSYQKYLSAWGDLRSISVDKMQSEDNIISIPEAVDLGLPSGLKWASFNLGASKPEDYGDYYAWGETEPYYSGLDPLTWKEGKEAGFTWSSYKWCMGADKTMTKYCMVSSYGYNGFTDDKTVLDLEDDAAHVNLGGNWRMPTDEEWTELRLECTWSWTSRNGVFGRQVTGPNGNSIFIPAAGGWYNTDLSHVNSDGRYWSSTLTTDYSSSAWGIYFKSDAVSRFSFYGRFCGQNVRPVSE